MPKDNEVVRSGEWLSERPGGDVWRVVEMNARLAEARAIFKDIAAHHPYTLGHPDRCECLGCFYGSELASRMGKWMAGGL